MVIINEGVVTIAKNYLIIAVITSVSPTTPPRIITPTVSPLIGGAASCVGLVNLVNGLKTSS